MEDKNLNSVDLIEDDDDWGESFGDSTYEYSWYEAYMKARANDPLNPDRPLNSLEWIVNGFIDSSEGRARLNYKLISTDEGFAFFKEETNHTALMRYIDTSINLTIDITYFHFCEPLEKGAEILGYRYKLSDDGKWGFISRYLAQITEPQYEDIFVSDDNNSLLTGIIDASVSHHSVEATREDILDFWLR